MKISPLFYVFFHDTDFIPIHTAEVIAEMLKKGIKVHVFTYRNVERMIAKNPELAAISLHPIRVPQIRFVSEIIFMLQLIPILLFFTLRQKPGAIYVRHSAVSLASVFIAKAMRIPCLIEINDVLTDKLALAGSVNILKHLWVSFYTRVSFTNAKALLPVTRQIGDWIKSDYHVYPNHIKVIPNGVNIHRFTPRSKEEARKRYNLPTQSPIILCLGSLFPWAGVDLLIQATPQILENHPDTLFVIGSGEEPYLSEMKKLAQKHQVFSNYKFLGFIPWDDASWFISMADICVAPFILKNTRSGLCSLRVLSYLACARPVVGCDIPGLGDMLEREEIGASFPMGNYQKMTHKINSLLKDRDKLLVMGKRGRKFVEKNHSWEIIVNQILDCLRSPTIKENTLESTLPAKG